MHSTTVTTEGNMEAEFGNAFSEVLHIQDSPEMTSACTLAANEVGIYCHGKENLCEEMNSTKSNSTAGRDKLLNKSATFPLSKKKVCLVGNDVQCSIAYEEPSYRRSLSMSNCSTKNPSNLERLSSLMVNLKETKDNVAIRGEWDMVAWLKNVRDKERQVNDILKECNEKPAGFFQTNLFIEDKLHRKLIETLTVVKDLIEKGNAGSKLISVHSSSPEKYQLKKFSSMDLMKFTDNFDKKIGSGGYSDVYQGEFEGTQVAVKVLKENDMVYETFLAERSTMGRIFHTNLVKLYGFCFDDNIKALVYEYMEKGSLDEILYKNPNSVDWAKLYGIALEVARGLAYLHHDCDEQIIHHDVKAANVLLGKNLCAKITDFGVSNLMRSDVTHLTNTRTRGTNYYSAPEIYQPLHHITCKCDVYSFGLMLFEILGRRCHIPKGGSWFPQEISEMFNKQPLETVMEYCGIMKMDREKAMIVLMVAMWCTQYTPTIRPSMGEVVVVLEKEMSVTAPPYPFQHHNLFGPSMQPLQQGVPVNDESSAEPKEYSRMDLEEFTSGFSNIIGTGSYGKVYRGKLRDGVEVAIKLFEHNFDIVQEEFLTEGKLLSKLYHKNIIRTYGYCFEENMMALAYEYIPCGTLDKIVYVEHHDIEWGRLYTILTETAKGLSYLHNGHGHQIIHFDIRPSSILLDNNFSPKITSFGLAKSLANDVSGYGFGNPSMITRASPGSISPESRNTSMITSKADVYSFGIMMFEVLGRRRISLPSLQWFPRQVWVKYETGKMEELFEDCGITWENREDAKILTMIALWCIQYTPRRRPSMGTVVKMLEKMQTVSPPPYPFYSVTDYVINKEEESEALLKLYEEKCPPGSGNSVIIYTTTIEKMKRPFKQSNDVRRILQSHQIVMIERDVYEDEDNEDVLNNVMGKVQIPVLFVKGRLIGGADEIKRLEAEGKLKVLLYGIPTE